MSMVVDNLVGQRLHGGFYIGAISKLHQQLVYKGIVGLFIPRIGRAITIWDRLFFKFRVSFDVLVSSKKVFSGSVHSIETHIDVVVEIIEV